MPSCGRNFFHSLPCEGSQVQDITITATKRHGICIAHRLPDHKGKCSRLHGHNLVVEITLVRNDARLLHDGMVIDFGVISERVFSYLDRVWDHRTLLRNNDPIIADVHGDALNRCFGEDALLLFPFDPTVENIASYWMRVVFPILLLNCDVSIQKIRLYETEKCYAEVVHNEVGEHDD